MDDTEGLGSLLNRKFCHESVQAFRKRALFHSNQFYFNHLVWLESHFQNEHFNPQNL